ncbi:MAG: DHHA1 domain-containing protein, partial [Polyangiales bacterium]
DLALADVQADAQGAVHHVVADASARPAVGEVVRGAVDVDRRRLHAALHTGQHMLSRALLDVAKGETVSSRLGATGATIDLDLATVDDAELYRAEELVVSAVASDLAVRQWFPDADALAALPLRRAPKVTERVRVVDIEGFDVSPCGGTHCARTSQVGPLSITGVERYKGTLRVTFLAGRAASTELRARSRALSSLGRVFTCGPHDVALAVEKMREELRVARESLAALREREAERLGDTRWTDAQSRGSSTVVATLDGGTVESLRALGARITAHAGAVALLAATQPDGVQVLASRGEGATFDCGAFVKKVAAAHGGRGGGRADRAEGRLPAGVDWAEVCAGA